MLRTHTCGDLSKEHLDEKVTLCGWVSRVRDHGGVNFIDLRDRWGITQAVFRPETQGKPAETRAGGLHEASKVLRPEFCLLVSGVVKPRPKGTVNKKIPTGEIEVIVESLEVLGRSESPPFELFSDEKVSEEVRLKYRYLDLRRPAMQKNLIFRAELLHAMRCFFHGEKFVEIETPVLTKSTPEGARDYLVPSRLNQGEFFALPQSPQIFKQILMISGFDRYFQIAKCFRDEDLRADRQPEFTQLDLEMSFVRKEDVYGVMERLFKYLFNSTLHKTLTVPFRKLSLEDARARYGTDKPDLRFGLELEDVTALFKETTLRIFKQTLEKKGVILALHVPKPTKKFTHKDFDDLITFAKAKGAAGLAYVHFTDEGIVSPISKFFSEKELNGLRKAFPHPVASGDVMFFAADEKLKAQGLMGEVRLELARQLGLASKDSFSFVWVEDYPLFNYNDDTKRWESEHHPFTGMNAEDISKLGKANGEIRSLSYDLVLNGNEIASGSIRIHDASVQKKVFEVIGLDAKRAQERFGFLLKAFEYGPPPHGGIAVGVDRLVAILLARDSIREVVAFPKTQKAICPMSGAPSPAEPGQLKEVGIKVL